MKTSERIAKLIARVAESCARRAWLTVGAALALTVLAIFLAATRLGINTDTLGMINPELDFRQSYFEFIEAFPQYDPTIIAVIRAPTPEQATGAQRDLAEAWEAQSDLFEHVIAPGAGDYFFRFGLLLLSDQELTTASARVEANAEILASMDGRRDFAAFAAALADVDSELKARMTQELQRQDAALAAGDDRIFSWQWVLYGDDSAPETTLLVIAKPYLDYEAIDPAEAALAFARQSGETIGADNGARILFTGEVPLNAEELSSVADGAALSGILSFVLVALVLGFGLRSGRLVAACLITLFSGLIITAGLAALTVGSLNLISVAFAVLFIGLGIDFAIHFGLRVREEMRDGVVPAVGQAGRTTGLALSLCAPSTALAFFAFVPTDFVGMAQLGIISGAGIFVALGLSLTLLPALLALFGTTPKQFALPVQAKDRPVLAWAVVGLAMVALIFVPQARFDGDPIELKDPDMPSVQAFQSLAGSAVGAAYNAQIIVDSREAAADLAATLEATDEVGQVIWYGSFLPRDAAAAKQIMAPAVDALSAARFEFGLYDELPVMDVGAFAQSVGLAVDPGALAMPDGATDFEQDLFASFGFVLVSLESAEGGAPSESLIPTSLRDAYVTSDGRYRLDVLPARDISAPADMTAFRDAVLAEAPMATGSAVEITGAAEVVSAAMLKAVGLAVVLVGLGLIILLRKPAHVLLVFVPVVLAGSLTLAFTVLFDQPFNFANVVVLPLLIGLGVDFGVHMVMRLREGGDSSVEASSTPIAVILSGLTTLGSFGTLMLSGHKGTASMGLLLTVAVLLLIICATLVLPVLARLMGLGARVDVAAAQSSDYPTG